MTGIAGMRKPAQLDLDTTAMEKDGGSDSDSVATASTEVSVHSDDETYDVEEIVAENEERGKYLVKWANYPEERMTWEPKENIFDDSIIYNWKATLAQQKAGKVEAFDVAAWTSKVNKLKAEKKERKLRRERKRRRREQKRRKGSRRSSSGSVRAPSKVLAGDDSDDEPIHSRKRLTKKISSVETSDDDVPLPFIRRASTDKQLQRKKTISSSSNSEDDVPLPLTRRASIDKQPQRKKTISSSDEDDVSVPLTRRASLDKQLQKKKTMAPDDGDVESELASDDSLIVEIRRREARRQARGGRERVGKENTKPSQEKQNRSETRESLQRSTDSPDAGSPLLRAREIPLAPAFEEPPSRTSSRDSVQQKAQPASTSVVVNQGAASVPPKRPRGRPPGSGRGGATRGGTRGRGRSGALPATSHVFSKSDVPAMRKKSLSNTLSGMAADSDAINQSELSKNLSHARKLEVAGRAKADRAPDLAVLGGLFNPAEIKDSPHAYRIPLKPRDSRQPSGQSQQPSGSDTAPTSSAPLSRRSSTNHVRFMDDIDDGPGVILEEPGSIVENQGNKGQNMRDNPSKEQVVTHGTNQPGAPSQPKIGNISIKPKPILRAPTTSNWVTANEPRSEITPNTTSSNWATANEWGSQQPLLPRLEVIPNPTSLRNTSFPVGLSSNPSNAPESIRPGLDRKISAGERKKVSLSEYNAKQRIEKGGNLVKQARFGTLDTSQTLIAFIGVSRGSQEPWVKEVSSLDTVNFVHVCSASDFQAQPPFVRARVLAHGSIATNSEATGSLDRLSDHLRLRLGGLVFSHHAIAILLFPTRLDEWKFLENTDVPNTIALRYHIFELPEFCPTISDPLIGIASPGANLRPPYWSSAVGFLCGLNYESLLPTMPPAVPAVTGQKKKEQDRDNFFLLIPENATPSPRFLTTWLKSCKPSCKVVTSQTPGAWSSLLDHAKNQGSAGSVIIHESLISQIPKLPQLQRLFSSKCNFAVFSLNSCPVPQPSLSSRNSISNPILKTRLFPLGAAFFLAPSLIVADPMNVLKFLRWFRNKQEKNSTPGTYKLLSCHRIKELILDIAIEKSAERRELIAQARGQDVEPQARKRNLGLDHNSARFQIYNIIEKIIDKAGADLPPFYDLDDLDDEESPIILAPEHIDPNDESKLLLWFAGWALLNVDKYKKFWVIGTDSSNIHKAIRVPLTQNTMDAPMSEVADLAETVSPSSPLENSVRWKKTGFTAITEVVPAPLFSTVAAVSRSNITEDAISPLTRSPTMHQLKPQGIETRERSPYDTPDQGYLDPSEEINRSEIMELERKIDAFIAITGSTDKQANDYLLEAGANLGAAVEAYKTSSMALQPSPKTPLSHPLPSRLPHMDVIKDASNPSSPNTSSRPSSRSGAITEENGRRIVPASTRDDGSTRKEISIRPGYVSQEDKEVWRPSVLSMLPRNVRQNASAHTINSRQRTIDSGAGAAPAKDDSGDVIMNEANQDDAPSTAHPPLPSHPSEAAPNLPPGGDDIQRRTESYSSGMYVTGDERSLSGESSPTKQEVRKTSSTPLLEGTTTLSKRMEREGQNWNHIRVLGIREAFPSLGIKLD